MSLKIKNNLIAGAEVELSPNSSDRHDEIDLIVLHCISLPEGQYANNYPKDLFLNKLDFKKHSSFESLRDLRVSPHLLINRDGSLVQFVPFNKCAWHAGQSSFEGRDDCNKFDLANDIDSNYCELLKKALKKKLNVLCYDCKFSSKSIKLNKKINLKNL